jgi:hypothetical protein
MIHRSNSSLSSKRAMIPLSRDGRLVVQVQPAAGNVLNPL